MCGISFVFIIVLRQGIMCSPDWYGIYPDPPASAV